MNEMNFNSDRFLQLSEALKPIQDSIARLQENSSVLFQLQNTLQDFYSLVVKQNDAIKTTKNAERKNWVLLLSDTLSKTVDALSQFEIKNFGADYDSNIVGMLSQETSYLIVHPGYCPKDSFESSSSYIISALSRPIFDKLSKICLLNDSLLKNAPIQMPLIVRMSTIIAKDDETLSMIVNACYELFYEEFGGDKLRTEELIKFDDYPALFSIKQLRLYYDHDIYHGNKVESKKEKIKETFFKLIDKSIPISVKDFKNVQIALYRQIDEWISALLEKINDLESGKEIKE